MPKSNEIQNHVDESDEVNVKTVAIKVTAMTLAAAATLVATNYLIKKIEKTED